MKRLTSFSIIFAFVSIFGLLLSFLAATAAPSQTAPFAQPQAGSELAADELVGGFIPLGNGLNSVTLEGKQPALVVDQASGETWAAFVQDGSVVASKLITPAGTWQMQGDPLTTEGGLSPALTLSGAGESTPWLTWVARIQGINHLRSAWFDGANWQITGNVAQLTNEAIESAETGLTSGQSPIDDGATPWVTWLEGFSGDYSVMVAHVVTDTSAPGGYRWEEVGQGLNLNPARNARHPDIAFAGETAWAVWYEEGAGRASRIFARRALSDTSSFQDIRWEVVGKVADCSETETACALNVDTGQDAVDPHIAVGLLTNESVATPWIVFVEEAAGGHRDIRVTRLDLGDTPDDLSDDRFIPVGGSVNQQCLGSSGITGSGGAQPDIYFVGNVPHVAWLELVGGRHHLYVCHLADIRPGQQRWDIDSYSPVHRHTDDANTPALASDGNTAYVAWQELSDPAQVYVDRRSPANPAWGRNYPPFIRTISWSREFVAAQLTPQQMGLTRPLTLTTSCYHAEGWEHIEEIQYKVVNAGLTAFVGRYVADENKLYVQDPANPQTYLGGVTPGSGEPISTTHAILYPAETVVQNRGPDSPVLDINWVIAFTSKVMNQDFEQQINIVYDTGETGFFRTGSLSFDLRMFMPDIEQKVISQSSGGTP